MARVVVALYEDKKNVQETIQALREAGFERETISMLAYDSQRAYGRMLKRQALGEDTAAQDESEESGINLAEGAGLGALIGSIGGLLAGLLALAIPGIGPVVAAGPLVTTLAGAGIGATAGGIIGALVDAGLPSEHAQVFTEGIRHGDTLLMVNTSDERAREAVEILNRHDPVDLQNRPPLASQNGKMRMESLSLENSVDGNEQNETEFDPVQFRTLFAEFEPLFHKHYSINYTHTGHAYTDYRPAYTFGCELAANDRYQGWDWKELEPQARQSWEVRFHDTPWENVKDAVQQAWTITSRRE